MDDIDYLMKEKARLLRKYNCSTIQDVIRILEKLIDSK